jgi:release factor glutamine methyltransferase
VKLCEIISEGKRTKVIEGDLIVPDIKPDILSISNIEYDIFITRKEIKDGKLYVYGISDVSAIYVAEDQKASTKSLNNVFDFLESFDIEGINDESIIEIKVEEELIEYKVMNGRKISVRIPITLDVAVKKNCEYTIAKDVLNNNNIETKKEEFEVYSLVDSKIQNIELNEADNVTLIKGDVLAGPEGITELDVIVSNPPYIPKEDLQTLAKEVQQEPMMALDGGQDGLDFYRAIVEKWTPALKADGAIAFEVGIHQAQEVSKLVEEQFEQVYIVPDLNDIPRVVMGTNKIVKH